MMPFSVAGRGKLPSCQSLKGRPQPPRLQDLGGIRFPTLHVIIVVVEVDIPRSEAVRAYKVLVARRPLVLGVARQHALQAHADALDVLNGAPPLLAKQVETYDAIRVYVRVNRDRSVR
jgi:hypothetical protein